MRIIVVDDDQDSRKAISDFIQQLGHQVFECSGGSGALEILKTEQIHLVLSDIMMPGMSGVDLLKTIKADKDLENTIVVLFTGYRDVNSAIEALRNGAYDYLLKPVKPEELDLLTTRVSEYLTLKEENLKLTEKFDKEVNAATVNIKKELEEVRKAYLKLAGVYELGVYSDNMQQVFATAEKLHNRKDIPVLIEGETGTGKEVIARFIHFGPEGITNPFVGLNCAAISENLFESELFGYEAGAFTGGNPKGQKGKIEHAENGSLFLDEITELTGNFQAKLLRVIQEREYYRVGGIKKYDTNARFICATNENIEQLVKNNEFRQDLYYRLNVGRIRIPPLRERKDEIIPFAELFMKQLRDEKKSSFKSITKQAADKLAAYSWPGNVRELKNSIERIAFQYDDSKLVPKHIDFLFTDTEVETSTPSDDQDLDLLDTLTRSESLDLKEFNKKLVNKVLLKHNNNKSETARFLNISRYEIYTYLKREKDK